MASVILDQISKTYSGAPSSRPAVHGVSLAIAAGEFMVLVGPSGCGKSTLLRLIAGLETADAGTISIAGRVVNTVPPKDRDLAMVFQNYALYPHLTVFENLAFGLKLRHLPKEEIVGRVRVVATQLGLDDVLDRLPKALSGGQRQRVAVGRAMVRQPKVFLFDEPLSNLDAQLRTATRAEISRLHARLAATMIYVTHDQVEAMTMGDRICVMNAGAIMQVASPAELYQAPANLFVASFMGAPPMNFIAGRVEKTCSVLSFVPTSSVAEPRPDTATLPPFRLPSVFAARVANHLGKPVIFGLRPEHLDLPDQDRNGENAAINAQIELVEPMGADTHLHLRAGGILLIARVPPSGGHRLGQRITLQPNLTRGHLFDAATGLAL